MEMSEAAGMRRLSESERNPLWATTFGVGEMILDGARTARTKSLSVWAAARQMMADSAWPALWGFDFVRDDRELNGNVSDLRVLTRIAPSPQSCPPAERRTRSARSGYLAFLKSPRR